MEVREQMETRETERTVTEVVTRNMFVKYNRKTYITTASGVKITIIPVCRDGYNSFDVVGPGVKIAHESLTSQAEKP